MAHWPGEGVNVYVPETVLLMATGAQEPVTALSEVVGRAGTDAPLQMEIEVPKLNKAVVFGVTVTVNVVVVAHCPDVGVNVYTPDEELLITAGFHVPVIPFADVVGKAGAAAPSQMVNEFPKLNVGVRFGFTVTVNVAWLAHCPAFGVNV